MNIGLTKDFNVLIGSYGPVCVSQKLHGVQKIIMKSFSNHFQMLQITTIGVHKKSFLFLGKFPIISQLCNCAINISTLLVIKTQLSFFPLLLVLVISDSFPTGNFRGLPNCLYLLSAVLFKNGHNIAQSTVRICSV